MMKNRWMNRALKYSNYLFVLLIGSCFFPYTSYGQVSVNIPIEQEFKINGSLDQEKQKGYYILEALEGGNPMPTGEAAYSIELLGNERRTIEGFDFSEEGTFSYKLYQQLPEDKAGFTYDDHVYFISVYVTRAANGLNIETIVKNDQKLKVSSAAFTNTYSANTREHEEDKKAEALTTTGRENGVSVNPERRLPSTGQLKENIWIIGLLILIFVLEISRRKQHINQRK